VGETDEQALASQIDEYSPAREVWGFVGTVAVMLVVAAGLVAGLFALGHWGLDGTVAGEKVMAFFEAVLYFFTVATA
jgi:hypothetical protein